MVTEVERLPQFESVRTLVRYVDEDQAIIEIHVALQRPLPTTKALRRQLHQQVQILVELSSQDGFHDEQQLLLKLRHRRGSVRWDVVRPKRWWPAGMGEQPLYELTVSLLGSDEMTDRRSTTIGFTSVRAQKTESPNDTLLHPHMGLIVNGQQRDIGSIVAIDRVHEHRLLPASGDSLLLVRDHYGPDILYEAADRAGIMLIQCVPIHPEGCPESDVPTQVSRLATHPSLAGWFIGHLGEASRRIARRLQRLDPTHSLITAAQQC